MSNFPVICILIEKWYLGIRNIVSDLGHEKKSHLLKKFYVKVFINIFFGISVYVRWICNYKTVGMQALGIFS